ncbi:hypothetical protein ERX37_07920 [Macrococcus hajekii]|uniref:Uncharacterized protein n=1 Tax=Macrococcus hajekii TaxID=198482 RepID=A0A4R6BIL5_9STAP|nr:hypothetical protein [Macrococcus hajekii]TDM01420.1 hypothetical protein ERX37_07920 [Macrococcus hajekii]GGA99825.1 hypothetical protein GCM10007190_04840 [Macrococcus hajekii]
MIKLSKIIKRIKLPGIIRRYKSMDSVNRVGRGHIDGKPVFVLMIGYKRDDYDKLVDPRKDAKETIIYEFDNVRKIDNWIEVLNQIKSEIEAE